MRRFTLRKNFSIRITIEIHRISNIVPFIPRLYDTRNSYKILQDRIKSIWCDPFGNRRVYIDVRFLSAVKYASRRNTRNATRDTLCSPAFLQRTFVQYAVCSSLANAARSNDFRIEGNRFFHEFLSGRCTFYSLRDDAVQSKFTTEAPIRGWFLRETEIING